MLLFIPFSLSPYSLLLSTKHVNRTRRCRLGDIPVNVLFSIYLKSSSKHTENRCCKQCNQWNTRCSNQPVIGFQPRSLDISSHNQPEDNSTYCKHAYSHDNSSIFESSTFCEIHARRWGSENICHVHICDVHICGFLAVPTPCGMRK